MSHRASLAGVAVLVITTLAMSWVALDAGAEPTPDDRGHVQAAADPVPGQYIVRLRDTAPSEVDGTARALAHEHGGTVFRTYDALSGFAARLTPDEALAMSTEPDVVAVSEDGVVHTMTTPTTETPTPSWGLDRIDQPTLPLDTSYSYETDGTGVTVYIIDTGILPTQTDFGGRASIGADFVGDGRNGVDCDGHGTHVAGTVGGTNYGVAKKVKIVAVRVLDCSGSGTYSTVIAGVNWVTANRPTCTPAVASMSLGGSFSSSMNDAVEQSIGAGITYVVAAGNGNNGVPQNASTTSPASAPDAITVGATGQTDARSSFSNYGPLVDLFAPGEGITSDWISSNTATKVLSGTSMATPHVTGVVARYLQIHPRDTPAEVDAALTAEASPVVTGTTVNTVTSTNLLLDAPPADLAPVDTTSCGEYHPLAPARILDTRGDPDVTCNTATGALGNDSAMTVKVTGCNGGLVPSTGVSAVVLNATVDSPTASSFLTVWPSGIPRPGVSNLNFVAGQTVPNLVTVRVGTNGAVSVYNHTGATHVILDVMGWYSDLVGAAGSRFHPLTPKRLVDTRDGTGGVALGPMASGAIMAVPLSGGTTTVPADATAIALNVTVTQPTASGFLTVYPGDLTIAPTVSNLNFVPGLTVPNLVIVALSGSGGLVKFLNSQGLTYVVADVVGYYDTNRSTEAGRFNALPPVRVLDTRLSTPLGPGATRVVGIAGAGGVPAGGAGAVVMNVTVTLPDSAGYLTVFPTGAPNPQGTSNLNFVADQTVPNLVMVGLGEPNVSAFNFMGSAHVIFDVSGYFTS